MNSKRITVFAGHYGSGKTNLALNHAVALRHAGEDVMICDLDIVNPYFRTKDSEEILAKEGIELICSRFANSNVDLPSIPPKAEEMFSGDGRRVVIDLGGDDSGSVALGRYAPRIEREGGDMLLVVNRYRYMTQHADEVIEIMREIEAVSHMRFTGVVNNSNLGAETTAETVLDSVPFAQEVCARSGLALRGTAYVEALDAQLSGRVEKPFPIRIFKKLIWDV